MEFQCTRLRVLHASAPVRLLLHPSSSRRALTCRADKVYTVTMVLPGGKEAVFRAGSSKSIYDIASYAVSDATVDAMAGQYSMHMAAKMHAAPHHCRRPYITHVLLVPGWQTPAKLARLHKSPCLGSWRTAPDWTLLPRRSCHGTMYGGTQLAHDNCYCHAQLLLLSLLFLPLQGVHLPASCRMGTCTSCVCKLLVRLPASCDCTAASAHVINVAAVHQNQRRHEHRCTAPDCICVPVGHACLTAPWPYNPLDL
jgi:hypothetical protein